MKDLLVSLGRFPSDSDTLLKEHLVTVQICFYQIPILSSKRTSSKVKKGFIKFLYVKELLVSPRRVSSDSDILEKELLVSRRRVSSDSGTRRTSDLLLYPDAFFFRVKYLAAPPSVYNKHIIRRRIVLKL